MGGYFGTLPAAPGQLRVNNVARVAHGPRRQPLATCTGRPIACCSAAGAKSDTGRGSDDLPKVCCGGSCFLGSAARPLSFDRISLVRSARVGDLRILQVGLDQQGAVGADRFQLGLRELLAEARRGV